MNERKRKKLIYVNLFVVLALFFAMFNVLYSSSSKLLAKTPLSLTLVEESVNKDQPFHIDISDQRSEAELEQVVEVDSSVAVDENKELTGMVRRELQLTLPQGINFDETTEKEMLKESGLAEFPVFQWNEEERTLSIIMSSAQTELRVVLTAESEGEYTVVLSDGSSDSEHQELKISVNTEQEAAVESVVSFAEENLALADSDGGEDLSTYDPNTVANVSNWEEFIRALGNVNISGINITSSFAIPSNPRLNLTSILTGGATSNNSGSAQYVYMGVSNIGRKVVIEGNNNLLDFGAIALCFYNTTGAWDLTWQNMTVYHGNYYGYTTFNDLSTANQQASAMRYHNVTNFGNQLMHSPQTDVYVSGKTSNNQMATYTTEFRTNWAINATNQINLYITNLTVLENAEFQMSSLQGGNIHLIGSGSLVIGKNAKMIVDGAQNELTGESDAQQTNLWIPGGGSVTLQEGALLQLTPKPQYSAIGMNGSGSKVSIGKGATLTINSSGHTSNTDGTNRNIVRLGAGATLEVAEEGTLDVRATGMGTSTSNLIHVQGVATFRVAKKGNFNAMSDSTGAGHSLIYFSSSGSTFQFADAERVNLERTNPVTNATATNNGLINIAGNGGTLNVDIQKVSMWRAGDFSDEPTMSWTPMYGMLLTYSGFAPTITSVSSLEQANIDNFRSNFTTRNVQRVLYEYIPDVDVVITSTATDEVDSSNSVTITGVTNPGAFVRLWDVPINETVTPAIDPSNDTVPSPVTAGGSAEFTNNFTVQADSSGNFSYTVPLGNHFTAGSTIHAYSFLNGKYDEATQVVLDKTPPTGEPRDFYAGMGNEVPSPSVFIQNPTDTNPLPQTFSYEYSDKNDLAALETMMNQIGTHTVYVNLMDDAGNTTEIEARLIVLETSRSITGSDFEASYLDIRDLSDQELEQFILANSNPEAYSIFEGVKIDLSSFITVSDFGGLNNYSNLQPNTPYTVTLTVPANDTTSLTTPLSTTIQVVVINMNAVLTVHFEDESRMALSGYTLTIGEGQDIDTPLNVGDVIDLTSAKFQVVQDQLAALELAGYEISQRPENEMSLMITETAQTVTYTVTGQLFLKSAPLTVDFGKIIYNAKVQRVDNPTTDGDLVVTDTRANKSAGWTLYAALTTNMKNDATGSVMNEALWYVDSAGDEISLTLDSGNQAIYRNTSGGNFDVTSTWGETSAEPGLKLVADPTKTTVSSIGTYSGVVTWTIMAGQP
ncbi:pectate lyase-like adhesive domain-containing protein [Candidatus Enterococcus clewellii]|nr:pectate lyase-like adhesive domain-containing protein [Enterococcus sp. 9E7_DIV0242]